MKFGEALYRLITNGRSPRTEPTTFPAALAVLIRSAGSAAGAARALGVSATTVRRWRDSGRAPAGRASLVVQVATAVERRARLKPGREKRLRKPQPGMKVAGKVKISDYEEERDIELGQYAEENAMGAAIDAYLAGESLDAIGDAFADGISGASFYEDLFSSEGPGEIDVDPGGITL